MQTLFDVELEDGRRFTVNNDHPMYFVEDGDFTFTDELAARFAKGKPVTFLDSKHNPVKIASLRMHMQTCKTYNLHVEGEGKEGHTYYANGILVHKSGAGVQVEMIDIFLVGPPRFTSSNKTSTSSQRLGFRGQERVLTSFGGLSDIVKQHFSCTVWSFAFALASTTLFSANGAEYCLGPYKGNSIVCCTTPSGWQGWKDDPHQRDSMKQLDVYTRAWLRKLVSFHQPNCKEGPECPYLGLDTRGRDSHGQPDVEAGLRGFLAEWEQPQDLSPRNPPCVVVSRFGSFHTENSGDLTIWRIRCPSGSERFVTLLAQRDVLVTIDLGGPDIKDIIPKLDSLKELARSVRILDASLTLPDIIEIDAARLSDGAIRQQLLQLTPLGTPRERVYDLLQSPRLPEDLHSDNGDLWTQIGSYSSAVSGRKRPSKEYRPPTAEEIRRHISDPPTLPPTITVRAFWKFDKEQKLRDIEIKREVIEFKPKR